ncbi:MAG: InlB B-repeat-containing protein [Clostridia bacterium]|nr:InlB B-repeat-containing protein [Clostridia bacterium]
MKTKKWVVSLLTIFMLFPMLCVPVHAQDEPEFRYELSVDGKDTVEVSTGDIITITLYLYRTDADAPYAMYAMQDEIRYDSEFFELVENSAVLSAGIQSTDLAVGQGMREFYMNYISFSGGAQWQPKTRIGSFQLRVIGTSGVATITNEDFLVSYQDGSGSYKCNANTLTIIRSTDCTIKFETNGGTPIDPVTAIYGELLTKPEDPVRQGKHLVGWYKDIHLTEEWNFDTDTVKGNMTLYAKWVDVEQPTTDTQETPQTPEQDGHCPICGKLHSALMPGVPLCLIFWVIVFILSVAASIVLLWLWKRYYKSGSK